MNKLINIVLSGLLWRQYKFLIVSLVLLIVVIFIVGQVHNDYIDYANTSNENANVGLSFIIKWLAWVGAVVAFFVSNHLVNKKKEREKAQAPSSTLQKILAFKANKKSALKGEKESLNKQTNDNTSTSDQNSQQDPFAQIREKQKLRSMGDFLIEKHDKK